MDQRLKDYTKYYETRMKKYEGSKLFKYSYETERAIYEAIAACEVLEDFKQKLEEGNLNVKNAIAMVKDKETGFLDLYTRIKEPVRAQSSEEILKIADSFNNETELINKTTDIDQANSVKITIDLFTDAFYGDFDMLENLEVWANAECEDEWRKELDKLVEEEKQKGREDWKSVLENNRKYDPDWNFDFDLIREERHRRLIPFPDEIVKKRIEQFKDYRGI